MKKIIILLTIALASAGIIGCGLEDGSSLKWKNKSTETVSDIKWKELGASTYDQEWNTGSGLANTAVTDEKNIEVLAGVGECVYGSGTPGELTIAPGDSDESGVVTSSTGSAVIASNTKATLVIGVDAKKK